MPDVLEPDLPADFCFLQQLHTAGSKRDLLAEHLSALFLLTCISNRKPLENQSYRRQER